MPLYLSLFLASVQMLGMCPNGKKKKKKPIKVEEGLPYQS